MVTRILNWYWQRVEARCAADPVCRRIQATLGAFAADVEAAPYGVLLGAAETLGGTRTVDGLAITFSVELLEQRPNGELLVNIDARARPNRTGWQPSRRFWKHPDGRVSYVSSG